MTVINFSARAYCKIILHAAKYPHCAINGLLLAKQKSKSDKLTDLYIEDAIPLFHLCLHVSPMAEVALTMVEQMASQEGLVIAGYYLANENINDTSIDKPAHRTISEKIAENYNGALLVVIDNEEITVGMNSNPLKTSQMVDGKWKLKDTANVTLEGGDNVTNAIYSLIKDEEFDNIIDFDNHFDDITLDWRNTELNESIEDAVEESSK